MRTYAAPVCESHVELPEGAGNATALNLRFKILGLTAFAGDVSFGVRPRFGGSEIVV